MVLPPAADLAAFRLTEREKEVLGCVLNGLSNRRIGQKLGISPNTVKAFLRLIMMKMGVSSRLGILGKLLANRKANGREEERSAMIHGNCFPPGLGHASGMASRKRASSGTLDRGGASDSV